MRPSTIARTCNASLRQTTKPTVSQLSRFTTTAKMSTGKLHRQDCLYAITEYAKLKPYQVFLTSPLSRSRTQTLRPHPVYLFPRSSKPSSARSSISSPAVRLCRSSHFGATMPPSKTPSLLLRAVKSTRRNGMDYRARSARSRGNITVLKMRVTPF
jgi:hypothetical protein